MELSGLVNLATRMAQARTAEAASTLVLKKALESQESTAATLIASITPSSSLPEHLGQNVNVVA
jgi:hypothetical protein